MIIDSFMFGLEYELDLLDIRLNYLYETVDKFILVEAKFTQLGTCKELFFDKNKDRYKKYLNKIIHIVAETPLFTDRKVNFNEEPSNYGWENENFQRNKIMDGLTILNIQKDDIIILSDLDEIPSIQAINTYKNLNLQEPVSLEQDLYYYYLNARANIKWRGSQIVRGNFFNNYLPQNLRDIRKSISYITDGGWHFSYMGGATSILSKINSVCETEAHDKYKNIDVLKDYIDMNTVHFNGVKLSIVEPPNFIDIKKYRHLIK